MTTPYKLYLDDDRDPKMSYYYTNQPIYNDMDWIVVRNYAQFTECIKELGLPNIVSFDHDLNDADYERVIDGVGQYSILNEKTGWHCAEWLINYCIDNKLDLPETIMIHSMNTVGSTNIKSLFTTYLKVWEIEHSYINDVYISNGSYCYNFDPNGKKYDIDDED